MKLTPANNFNAKHLGFGNAEFASRIADIKLKPSQAYINTKKYPVLEALALVTALVSTAGFGVGGAGLAYDCLFGKNKKDKSGKEAEHKPSLVENIINKEFENFQNTYNKIYKTVTKKDYKEEEIGHIKPDTKFGKLGVMFAKVGVGFSGIAGIFNGIAMKVPLMSLGEASNVLASPIINTPMGSGLMDIGLAAIFAGRALENDPSLKLNPVTLASKNGFDKVRYVCGNMMNCAKEVCNSSKEVFGNTFNLLKPLKRKEAVGFLRDNILAIRPSTIQFSEKILADGTKVIETGLKSSPHRMHTASLILTIGGAIKVVSSLFKNKAGQKAGFRVSEVGGGMDNLGLSLYGLERTMLGDPLAGIPLAISGATILSGQPTVDKKEGRSLMWLGCSALFLTFLFDRHRDLGKAFKEVKKLNNGELEKQSAQLIRTWSIPLTSVMDRKNIKPHLSILGKAIQSEGETAARKTMEKDPKVMPVLEMVDKVKGVLKQGLYNPDTVAEKAKINKALNGTQFAGKIKEDVSGDLKTVLKEAHHNNSRVAGASYRPVIEQIKQDSRYNCDVGQIIKDAAQEALKNKA